MMMPAVTMDVSMVQFLGRGGPDCYDFDAEMQRHSCKRVVGVDRNVFIVHAGDRYDADTV